MILSQRVDAMEQYHTCKKPRLSSVRHCWRIIREDARASRDLWCHPGEVFELYSDGVGPLLPCLNESSSTRRSIVVHSPLAETMDMDDHPDPRNPDSYVRVVLVCSPFLLPTHPLFCSKEMLR